MQNKNFDLLKALNNARMTQGELVKKANLSSEARLSRIINGYVVATQSEIEQICTVLQCTSTFIGFTTGHLEAGQNE